MQAGPQNGGDNAADEAGTSERRQTVLGAQRNAGGKRRQSCTPADGRQRANGANADGLQQGGNAGDEQTAGPPKWLTRGGKADAGANKQRNGQNIKNENDDLLDTQRDRFFDGGQSFRP